MTERQKKIAIIAVVVIVAILLLFGRKAGSTIVNNHAGNDLDYTIPGNNIPERGGLVVNIPGLPDFTPYAYSPISPCMCNGASGQLSPAQAAGISLTFVTNEGNSGGNIYNYAAPKQSGSGAQWNPGWVDTDGIRWAS